jgi:serine/threonine-protein kinase PpkA
MAKTLSIPGFKIKKELGAGGMAKVFMAVESKLDRPVALKVLSPVLADNPRITKRFVKEAKTAAHLQHSNIVSIYDVGKHESYYYIAMEYLSGSLKEKINNNKSLNPREALVIVREVAKALAYAHNKGFVHRDIKPDNIMFRKDGVVVLVDFGIVKAVNESEQSKLTRTGMSIGTPQYMSPEQIKAEKIDGRSDIYSMGIVLYEMLTGEAPFKADSVITLALKHTGEPVPSLPNRLSDFQPLLDKMLAKKPKERVRNAEGLIRLIDALDHKLKDKTQRVNLPDTAPEFKKKSRAGTWIALFIILVLVAGSLYLINESRRKEEAADWLKTQEYNTTTAYRIYMDRYPEGKHRQEAELALKKLEKVQQYNAVMEQAKEHLRRREYEKALQKTSDAAKMNNSTDVQELQKDIRKARDEADDALFNEYLDQAEQALETGDREAARELLEKAKQIKTGERLTALEEKLSGDK